jgi:hypothetical protein
MKIAGASAARWAGAASAGTAAFLTAAAAFDSVQPLAHPASLAAPAPAPTAGALFCAEAHAALAPSTAHATIDIFMASFPL